MFNAHIETCAVGIYIYWTYSMTEFCLYDWMTGNLFFFFSINFIWNVSMLPFTQLACLVQLEVCNRYMFLFRLRDTKILLQIMHGDILLKHIVEYMQYTGQLCLCRNIHFFFLELLRSNILMHAIDNNKASKSCCRMKLFSSRILSLEIP